jgi:hypothetical protein
VWFTDHREVDDSGRSERGALAELGRSARGWHGVDAHHGLGSAAGRPRLRISVALTHATVITMVLAASASWWPDEQASVSGQAAGALVEITDHNGATACGELLAAPAGTIRIETKSGTLEAATAALAGVAPADAC